MEHTFVIRAYGRTELAQLYLPHLTSGSAYTKLMQWINRYPHLTEQLRSLGDDGRQRTWTPAQVALIVAALGEP